MATYTELHGYRSTQDYQDTLNRVVVAVAIKAEDIASAASPTAEEIAWAISALNNPRSQANSIINFVLAANNTMSLAQITAASDSAIQANVDTAVDTLYGV